MNTSTQQSGTQGKAPRIPAAKGYVARVANPEITVGASNGGGAQIGWRIQLFKRKGEVLESVGSIVHYRMISTHETTTRITKEHLEAFGATFVAGELPDVIRAKRKTLTGFGSQDAEANVSYRSYQGKEYPEVSIYGASVKMKNALDPRAGNAAADALEVLLRGMSGNSTASTSTGAALPDFDEGTDPADDFDRGDQGADLDVAPSFGGPPDDDMPQF